MDGSSMAYHGLFGSAGGSDSGIHKCTILNNGQHAGNSGEAGKTRKARIHALSLSLDTGWKGGEL